MATSAQWAHAIVACVLLAIALLLPVVFAFVTLIVPGVRERRAKWRLRERREEVKETDAVVAEPHYCGGFRVAIARGKLSVVKAMTATWERRGLVCGKAILSGVEVIHVMSQISKCRREWTVGVSALRVFCACH